MSSVASRAFFGCCASNHDCSSNEVCLNQVCVVQSCTTSSQCGLGSACIGNQCVPVQDGGSPDLDGGIDLDAGAGDGGLGAHCINNAQCGEGWFCGTDYQCHPIQCSLEKGGVCGPTDGGLDGGQSGDGGVSTDGGVPEDGGVWVDGGLPEDGGQPDGGDLDGGEAPDAGVEDGGTSAMCRADFDCLTGQHCVAHVCQ